MHQSVQQCAPATYTLSASCMHSICQLYMPRPVVATEVIVHVAADGRTEADPAPKELSVELIREDNSTVMLTPHPVTLDCRQQELHVTVIHDLSKPFYKSHGQWPIAYLPQGLWLDESK